MRKLLKVRNNFKNLKINKNYLIKKICPRKDVFFEFKNKLIKSYL